MASVHPLDLTTLGAKPGDVITVASRRGTFSLYARADDGTPQARRSSLFATTKRAANLLTNAALDPFGKIPELQSCAVRVTAGAEVAPLSSFGGGQLLAAAD